jgi:Phage terminase large subunit (GpA)
MPAIAAIARDDHPIRAIVKSSQTGVSELVMNLALHAADIGWGERGNVAFYMPTRGQMDDFTQGRLDPALQDNDYMRSRRPKPARKTPDNRRVKQFGKGFIYLGGADSRRQMKSVPADVAILDEYDEMGDDIFELAAKRLGSSRRGRMIVASTPTIPETGIDALLQQSDQRKWFIPCPACSLEQTLRWPENIDMEEELVVCEKCRAPMDVLARGVWIAQQPGDMLIHGYYVPRLLSPWADITAMIEASRATSLFAQQEFMNSDLGLPFAPANDGISVEVIDRNRRAYRLEEYAGQSCDMGIDVGTVLNVVIRERVQPGATNATHGARLWFAGEVSFEKIESLMTRFNVKSVVMDGQPEIKFANAFALAHKSRVYLGHYGQQVGGHVRTPGPDREPNRYVINRLQGLDEMYERFRSGTAELPANARELGGRVKSGMGEYYRQLLASRRTLVRDGHANWTYHWEEGSKADDYAHAELYCMIASIRHGGRILRIRRIG